MERLLNDGYYNMSVRIVKRINEVMTRIQVSY